MTIIYNYRKIEKGTDKTVVNKFFTDTHALEVTLRNEYAALTPFEQKATKEDLNDLIDNVISSGWDDILRDMTVGKQNEIPFGFESNDYFYFVDVILHKQTDTVEQNTLYDYCVTEGGADNIVKRYLFDDVHDLQAFMLDEFYADDDIRSRIDRSKLDAAFINIDTASFKQAIDKIRADLDFYEVFTIHFDFELDGYTHNVDVLVKGV